MIARIHPQVFQGEQKYFLKCLKRQRYLHTNILGITEPEFVNVSGIDSKESIQGRPVRQFNRVIVPARQVSQVGGIDSLESIPEFLKRLQIRALIFHACFPGKLWFSCMFKKENWISSECTKGNWEAELLTTVFGVTEYIYFFLKGLVASCHYFLLLIFSAISLLFYGENA